jgi:hypothetical protein
MNNNSSAGDFMSVSHGQSLEKINNVGVRGWFDILHTCGLTGEVTDYSGPNCILGDGLNAMLRGLTSNTTANDSGRATTKTGILLSGHDDVISPGADVAIAATGSGATAFSSLACVDSGGTLTDRLYNHTGTGVYTGDAQFDGIDGGGSAVDGGGGIFYQGSGTGNDAFTVRAGTAAAPQIQLPSAGLVVKANVTSVAAQVVDAIFVVNQAVANITGYGDIDVLAGRAVSGTGTGDWTSGPITMNNNDTLTINYTITLTAS